ncbi:glycosyltransferase [Phytohabitans sp. ZYX-F-186]|uniref:Glycosyltransferase n=1 Tax=Phytohabitans maris TaxID=3071409 RepID=A0ABU0ZF85_9ACTN|nr:glycosyltransferase [Phytohabitans sp. ZYX-F-186]MDQ7904970.1 glycosyltransferase [Phytohabitans sp. ZYX-F-186]
MTIRTAMITGPAPPHLDGVADYAARLAGALGGAGLDVEAVPLRPPAPGRWLAATVEAADRVRRMRPDLVHVQFAPSAYRFSALPGLLPRLLPAGTRLVTTLHEYGWWTAPAWIPAPAWRPLERLRLWDRETALLVPASRAVVVTNPDHGAEVRRRTGRRAVLIPIAPNVDRAGPPPDRAATRRRLGLGFEDFLLVFFGFVHPVKGVRYLLEALPALRSVRPGVRLVVAGGFASQALPEGEARAFRRELETLADRRGVAGAVTFTGYLPADEVSALLAAADAAVLPFTAGVSVRSGALLAALAHGVPTAVTVPDQPDPRLRDGENVAAIRARRDAAAIAVTLRRLIVDARLRERLAEGGRSLAAGHTWPAVARAHLDLYERVLADA